MNFQIPNFQPLTGVTIERQEQEEGDEEEDEDDKENQRSTKVTKNQRRTKSRPSYWTSFKTLVGQTIET